MFTVKIEAFAAGGAIPVAFTCDGENLSSTLSWAGEPQGTQSFALIMDDPDALREHGIIGSCGTSPPTSSLYLSSIERPAQFS